VDSPTTRTRRTVGRVRPLRRQGRRGPRHGMGAPGGRTVHSHSRQRRGERGGGLSTGRAALPRSLEGMRAAAPIGGGFAHAVRLRAAGRAPQSVFDLAGRTDLARTPRFASPAHAWEDTGSSSSGCPGIRPSTTSIDLRRASLGERRRMPADPSDHGASPTHTPRSARRLSTLRVGARPYCRSQGQGPCAGPRRLTRPASKPAGSHGGRLFSAATGMSAGAARSLPPHGSRIAWPVPCRRGVHPTASSGGSPGRWDKRTALDSSPGEQ
jgi:hypothetical protein